MEKFMEWFGRNRYTIGFVAGAANVGFGSVDARMFK